MLDKDSNAKVYDSFSIKLTDRDWADREVMLLKKDGKNRKIEINATWSPQNFQGHFINLGDDHGSRGPQSGDRASYYYFADRKDRI
jgi:hypothetical protein